MTMMSEVGAEHISSSELMKRAHAAGLAIPAFNIPYLPMVKPVVEALRDEDCFGFVTVARLEWIKFESRSLEAVSEEYDRYKDLRYVRLHLDHIPVIDEDNERVDYLPIIRRALETGYDSVMLDASRLSFDENIAATRSVVELAHATGLPVEAELGAVFGHEGDLPQSYDEIFAQGIGFTEPEEARAFATASGCDWLSVAVGSIHGAVSVALRDKPKERGRIDLGRLEAIANAVRIPLVLHGGSGIEPDMVQAAIRLGIAKVNVGTEIRQAYEQELPKTESVESARQRVYERTRFTISDTLALTGSRAKLFEG